MIRLILTPVICLALVVLSLIGLTYARPMINKVENRILTTINKGK